MTAPTTEQVREAVERLRDYATELENTVAGGGQFFAPRDCKGFAADIRTVLDALEAKVTFSRDDAEVLRRCAASLLDAGYVGRADDLCWLATRIESKLSPAPSAPASLDTAGEPPKCPAIHDQYSLRCSLDAGHRLPHKSSAVNGSRLSWWDNQSRCPASPVPSVTPMVTDEDVRRALRMIVKNIINEASVRRVLEDFASRKGADKIPAHLPQSREGWDSIMPRDLP